MRSFVCHMCSIQYNKYSIHIGRSKGPDTNNDRLTFIIKHLLICNPVGFFPISCNQFRQAESYNSIRPACRWWCDIPSRRRRGIRVAVGPVLRVSMTSAKGKCFFAGDKSTFARDRTTRSPVLYLRSASTKTYVARSHRLYPRRAVAEHRCNSAGPLVVRAKREMFSSSGKCSHADEPRAYVGTAQPQWSSAVSGRYLDAAFQPPYDPTNLAKYCCWQQFRPYVNRELGHAEREQVTACVGMAVASSNA